MNMRTLLVALSLLLATTASADVVIRDHADQAVVRYDRSYALLIGVSDYTAGWNDLTSIPSELDQVEEVLVEHGFEITKVLDPTERELRDAFEDFIDARGYVASHRLLVYFAGHGYSRRLPTGARGYLVPADAPRPTEDLAGFLGKAVSMGDVANWARRIEALHALFVFDSCFSGTVFDVRSELPQPSAVTSKMAGRVRQFLTAGSADEEVPGRSQFAPAFVAALRGAADLVPDGYVTGAELGVYLDQKARLPGQTPQFGRLPGYHEGDFVFRLATAPVVEFDLDDLQDRARTESSWAAYQRKMSSAFQDVDAIDGGHALPATKVEAWQRFLDAFAEKNPHSDEDDDLRRRASKRIERWRLEETDEQRLIEQQGLTHAVELLLEVETLRARLDKAGATLAGDPYDLNAQGMYEHWDQAVGEKEDELQKALVEYLNERPLVEGGTPTPAQRRALDMKIDLDLRWARGYIEEGGDYDAAIEIYERDLRLDPGNEELAAALAEAERLRFMSRDRFDQVEKGMSQGQVQSLLGTVEPSNTREFPDRDVLGWFYPTGNGGAAGVYFKKDGWEWRVYATDFEAVVPATDP